MWLRRLSFALLRPSIMCLRGSRPGTVVGPLLFLILPKSMTNNCAIFADDTTAYTTGKNITTTTVGLPRDVTAASSWADIWGMLFNAEKSEHNYDDLWSRIERCGTTTLRIYGWHSDTTSENSQTSGSNLQLHSDLEQPHRQGVRKVHPTSRDSTEVEKNISLPRTSPHLCWRGTAHHGV